MKKSHDVNRRMRVFTAAILLMVLCIFAVPAAAEDDVPSLPMQMCGTAVDINGNPLPAGTVITATVDGITSTYIVSKDGKIGESGTFGEKFLITGKTSGSQITFAVNGVESEQKIAFGTGDIIGTGSTAGQLELSFPTVVEKKDDSKSSSGSGAAGTKSIIATPNPTPVPTTEPTTIPTPVAQPTISIVPVQPPAQTSTPAPFIGILAGLGAAACVFGLRRK